ncbi:MAG TPA: LOG family protein, partial [Ilumatobacteraceae bacterium]
GGFGTLDETFELLTLTQTGKGLPVPIVFLDTPGDPYWETVHDFVDNQLVKRGLVAAADTELYLVTSDRQEAVDEIIGFYRNYDSIRYVGHVIVMRLKHAPTDEQIAELNDRFGEFCSSGGIVRATPFDPERKENDKLDLARITFTLMRHSSGILREVIDAVNSFVDA